MKLSNSTIVTCPLIPQDNQQASYSINYYEDGKVEVLCNCAPTRQGLVIAALEEVLSILKSKV
jgi:hypothetical protein